MTSRIIRLTERQTESKFLKLFYFSRYKPPGLQMTPIQILIPLTDLLFIIFAMGDIFRQVQIKRSDSIISCHHRVKLGQMSICFVGSSFCLFASGKACGWTSPSDRLQTNEWPNFRLFQNWPFLNLNLAFHFYQAFSHPNFNWPQWQLRNRSYLVRANGHVRWQNVIGQSLKIRSLIGSELLVTNGWFVLRTDRIIDLYCITYTA